MKKTILVFLILVISPLLALAQNQTSVTGTLVDPNGIPFYPATVTACLTPFTRDPIVNGQHVNSLAGSGGNYCPGNVTTTSNGFFSMAIFPNAAITPSSTQYQFTVNSPGTPPPGGKGSQTYTVTVTISGTSQDVSASLNAAATALLNSSGLAPNGPGIPSYNGPNIVYASNYGVKAQGIRYTDCSFVGASKIVNCGITPSESDPPFTASMLTTGPGGGGWLVFGTNGSPANPAAGSTASAVLPVGTITAVNSATQIQVSIAATVSCTSFSGGNDQCQLFIAPTNDTAALQAATTAAFNTTQGIFCGLLHLPQGLEWIDHPPTISSSVGCNNEGEANGLAAGATVEGEGTYASVLVPVPNASWTAIGVNSAAFFFTSSAQGAGFRYRNFSIDGIGQYGALAGTSITQAALRLSQNSEASYVGVFGWGIANGIIASGGDAAEAIIDHCYVNAGSTYNINAFQFVKITNTASFWNVGIADLFVNGTHVTSVNNSWDNPATVLVASPSGELYSTDDLWRGLNANGQFFVSLTGVGVIHINHANMSVSGSFTVQGLNAAAGTTAYLEDTKILLNTAGAQALNIAGTLYDLGANVIQTSTANSITGTLINYASEPSIAGRCLLTSAAGPLACGNSSNGKVAIPTTTATYTVNTTAVQSGSTITITPTTDNTGIPGVPTCVLPTNTAVPSVSATVAATSFTIAETSTTGITCYEWSIR